ncbi:uncharacterized protein OCT59_007864 [Rhizophagus irregularis]|nr:hypothetical protein OCT59_007864 [Rhizophagus irregularis]
MIFGISQDPNTKDYIIVFQDKYCKFCSEKYIIPRKWNKWYESCKSCKVKDLTNLISSGSEKIDNFIQVKQLKIINKRDNILEWIPYNQFTDINEMNEDSLSAIWMDGPLYWETSNKKYTRTSNVGVVLKYLHNIQSIDEFLNKV